MEAAMDEVWPALESPDEYVQDDRVFHESARSGAWQPAPPSEASASLIEPATLKARAARDGRGSWKPVHGPKLDATGRKAALWAERAPRNGDKAAESFVVGGVDCLALARRHKDCWVLGDAEARGELFVRRKEKRGSSGIRAGGKGDGQPSLTQEQRAQRARCRRIVQELAHADSVGSSPAEWLPCIKEAPWAPADQLAAWQSEWAAVDEASRREALSRSEAVCMAMKRAVHAEAALAKLEQAEFEVFRAIKHEGIHSREQLFQGQANGADMSGDRVVQGAAVKMQGVLRGCYTRKRFQAIYIEKLNQLEDDIRCLGAEAFRQRNMDELQQQAKKQAALALEMDRFRLAQDRRTNSDRKPATAKAPGVSRPLHLQMRPGLEVARLSARPEMGLVQQQLGAAFELYVTKLWRLLSQVRAEVTQADPTQTVTDLEGQLRACRSYAQDRRVSRVDLDAVLQRFCPSFSVYERELLLTYWDANVDGLLPVELVCDTARGALSDRRHLLCNMVYDKLYFAHVRSTAGADGRRQRLVEFYSQFAPDTDPAQVDRIHEKYKDTEKVNRELFTKLYEKYAPKDEDGKPMLAVPDHYWSKKAIRRELERRCSVPLADVLKRYRNVLRMDISLSEGARAAVETALQGLEKSRCSSRHLDLDFSLGADAELRRADWLAFHAELSAGIANENDFETVVLQASQCTAAEWAVFAEGKSRKMLNSKDRNAWMEAVGKAEEAKMAALRTSLSAAAFDRYTQDLSDALRKVRAALLSVCGTDRNLDGLEEEFQARASFGDDRKLSHKDFAASLTRYGIVLKAPELRLLQLHYDHNNVGYVAVDGFFWGVLDHERRAQRAATKAAELQNTLQRAKRQKRWLRAISSTVLPEHQKEWTRHVHKDDNGDRRPFWFCRITGERTWKKPRNARRADRHAWQQEAKRRAREALELLAHFRDRASEELEIQVSILSRFVGSTLAVLGAGLETLPGTVLSDKDLSEVQSLVLDDNALCEFPQALRELARLRHLSLGGNRIEALPAADLKRRDGCFGRLFSLDLSRNRLHALPKFLNELGSLRELEVQENQIASIHAESFAGLELEVLDLSSNRLRVLPPADLSWRSLESSLRWLSLRNNQLVSLPEALGCGLRGLCSLDLSDNRIAELPETFGKDMPQLETLQLQGNNMMALPESIGEATSLRRLSLQHNAFSKLPAGLAHLHELRELFLHNNRITQLPDRFGDLGKLEVLHVHCNRLARLPASFGELDALETCWMHQNELVAIPRHVPASLKAWKLHNNRIRELPDSVGAMLALEHLDLAGNRLERLPPSFHALKKLTFLRLDDNPLGATLAEIVRTGTYRTPDEQSYCLLLRKLVDSIKSTTQRALESRIDVALGVTVEQAVRESQARVREQLQKARDVKLGAGVKGHSKHRSDKQGAGDSKSRALPKSRTATQQALSRSLERFAGEQGGENHTISAKAFQHCIQVVGSLLTTRERCRLTARVFQIFDPKDTDQLDYDLFVVSIEHQMRVALGKKSKKSKKSEAALAPEPTSEERDQEGAATAAGAGAAYTGPHVAIGTLHQARHREVADAVLRYCSVLRAKTAVSTMARIASSSPNAGDNQERSPNERVVSAEELKALAERSEELDKEAAQLQRQLDVSRKRANIVRTHDKLSSRGGVVGGGTPRAAQAKDRRGSSAKQAKAELRETLRQKQRHVEELKSALQQTRAVARHYNEEMAEQCKLSRAKGNKKREKAREKRLLEDLTEEERQARKAKRERLTKLRAIFLAHSRQELGGTRQVLSQSTLMTALGEFYRRFGRGRLGIEPRQWRERLLANVHEAFNSGYRDPRSGRFVAFDRDSNGAIDFGEFLALCLELEQRLEKEAQASAAADAELLHAAGVGQEDELAEAEAKQEGQEEEEAKEGEGESGFAPSKACTINVDFVATSGRVVPISVTSLQETVRALKARIAFSEAIPEYTLLLLADNKRLADNLTLAEAGIQAGGRVKVVIV